MEQPLAALLEDLKGFNVHSCLEFGGVFFGGGRFAISFWQQSQVMLVSQAG